MGKHRQKRKHSGSGRSSRSQDERSVTELLGILDRAKTGAISEADYATLRSAVDTLTFLTQELAAKGTSIERLRKLLFGASTEKTRVVVGDPAPVAGADAVAAPMPDAAVAGEPKKPKAPGHGRNGAADYLGADQIKVPHPTLCGGGACPGCDKGKVYPTLTPIRLLRVRGMAPLAATVYEKDRLRCNLCGETFTAESPPGIGDEKYDESAAAMIGLLKYGTGVPFNRIEKLEKGLGIPLPASTQWEIVERAAALVEPAHEGLIDQAAQGDVLHNDDTHAKILEMTVVPVDEDQLAGTAAAEPASAQRTGVFTTGIVSQTGDRKIALFFTGRKHAGENLEHVLLRRAEVLSTPIQMCDALSRNLPGELKTILAHCIAHGRRRFVDVADDFPEECRHLLETLSEVYKTDALARQQALSKDDRLRLHQTHSAPLMADLHAWLNAQFDERKVEPNSGLGEAITYMLKHWLKLTLFLRVAGAPLDNNVCERALKKAILHRKNAMFFKTQNGARVGDIFMSLVHTAELNRQNPFEYLVALQRNHEKVAAEPADWMPWNYQDTLGRLATQPSPPG